MPVHSAGASASHTYFHRGPGAALFRASSQTVDRRAPASSKGARAARIRNVTAALRSWRSAWHCAWVFVPPRAAGGGSSRFTQHKVSPGVGGPGAAWRGGDEGPRAVEPHGGHGRPTPEGALRAGSLLHHPVPDLDRRLAGTPRAPMQCICRRRLWTRAAPTWEADLAGPPMACAAQASSRCAASMMVETSTRSSGLAGLHRTRTWPSTASASPPSWRMSSTGTCTGAR